jgi:phthalate 4,5-cis-dihydrodiol dehydrogenase
MVQQTTDAAAEAAMKAARNYGGSAYAPPAASSARAWQHFGFMVVSCDRADFRPTPKGVEISGDRERRFEPLPPPAYPRPEVIDELVAAVVDDRPPTHDGEWARATLEACLAILQSAREQRDVLLRHQVSASR